MKLIFCIRLIFSVVSGCLNRFMNIVESRENPGDLLCVNCMRKAGEKGTGAVAILANVRMLKVWPQSYRSVCRNAKPGKKKHGHIFHVKSFIMTVQRRPERVVVNYVDGIKTIV